MPSTIVILGTGGTIAGTSAEAGDNVGYTAAQRTVAQLLAAVPVLAGQPVEAEQLAQLDSKDMDHATWQRLARRLEELLKRDDVAGVVVTHGTDTLEETAWFLQRVLAPAKPVVLTAAMRPATALAADGPQNLLDAVSVAREPGARGVVAVLAGRVHGAADVRKQHSYRPDAFDSGDAGPIAVVEEGRLRRFRDWPGDRPGDRPQAAPLGLAPIAGDPADWPWVAVVGSHAGADPRAVRALLAAGVRGLVVAATGNGTLHVALQPALDEAARAGVPVWTATRCAAGVVLGGAAGAAAALSPWAARVELMLQLLATAAAADPTRPARAPLGLRRPSA